MALAAWGPLNDCKAALELLKKDRMDSPIWRLHWVTCLTLLRAVGHVLDKKDGNKSAKHREAVQAAWADWKKNENGNAIVRRFIEAERNNLLKQYKFGVKPEPEYLVDDAGNRLITDGGDALVTDNEFFRLSVAGFEDKEGRNVVGDAIVWWERELSSIEAALLK
jgi:hypothetical protein